MFSLCNAGWPWNSLAQLGLKLVMNLLPLPQPQALGFQVHTTVLGKTFIFERLFGVFIEAPTYHTSWSLAMG